MDTNQVQQAIATLYGTSNQIDREHANQFLLAYVENEAAWRISLELLQTATVPQVQYFAANVLYTKVCRDWLQLQDQTMVSSLSGALITFLKRSVGSEMAAGMERIVILRVCLALAALSIKLQDGLVTILQEAFQFLGGSPEGVANAPVASSMVGLCLIRSLPEEIEKVDMSRNRRDELQSKLRECCPNILLVVEAVMTRRQELSQPALESLEAWLGLGIFTLTSLSRDSPALFHGLASILASALSAPSWEVFVATCKLLTRLAGISEYPRPSGRDAAAQKLFEAILTGLSSAMPSLEGQEEAIYTYCSFIIELAKQEVAQLATGERHSLQIIEVLLAMTNHGNMNISTMALEFWEALGEVPSARRDTNLGRPLYVKLVDLLVGRLSYPSDFISWEEEVNIDSEEFSRYREGDLAKELLESCYSFLRVQYFLQLRQHLLEAQQGNRWQVAEVVLLMMQEVARIVSSYLEHGHLQDSAKETQDMALDQVLTAQALLELMHQHISTPTLHAHPLVLRCLLRLLGSYQPLLIPGGYKNPRLQGFLNEENSRRIHRLALQCILQGLSNREIGTPAAIALRSLCVGSLQSGIVRNDAESLHLLTATLPRATESGQEIGNRLIVVEAIIRTLVAIEDPGRARSLLNHFMTPIIEGLVQVLDGAAKGNGGQQVVQAVGDGLQLVGQVLRFVDADTPSKRSTSSGGGQQNNFSSSAAAAQSHLAQDLVGAIWPLLEQTAQLARGTNGGGSPYIELLDQLFPLYRHLVVGLRLLVAPLLPELLSTVVDLFGATAHEGALETVGQVVEMFKEGGATLHNADQAGATFASLFSAMCTTTFGFIRRGHAPRECPNLITAFFDMTLRYLAFRPTVLYAASELPTILDLALLCLESAERESTRTVLKMLRELMKHLQDGPHESYVPGTVQMIAERGQQLMTLTLSALAGRAPTILWANYFEFFFAILQAWPVIASPGLLPGGRHLRQEQAILWVNRAINDVSVLGEAFSNEDRSLLVELIGRLLRESKQKLKLLMDDVSKICNSEAEVNALSGYQT